MALTQMQLIQSLGEALSWLERELTWGVQPTELRHLCGRIGELYTALITNGQMAERVNQRGYDVVSSDGERISVKTTAMMGNTGHVSFNSNSLGEVDRVVVLRINTEEMQVETLLNASIQDAVNLMSTEANGTRALPLRRLIKEPKQRSEVRTVKEVSYLDYIVRELETGSIEVEHIGEFKQPVKPVLRDIARHLNISLVSSSGNTLTTRQLGSQIIKAIQELHGQAQQFTGADPAK
jgi:hypothetical protein